MLKVRKRERDVEIPSSSMADIAFLLLVFFLLTTTIDMEKGLDIVLPPDNLQDEVKIPKENLTNILINETGNVQFGGEIVDINDVKKLAQDKLKNPNMIFSLKTVRDTRYNIFINVFDQLKSAGAKKISIAEPDEG